jgi:hypothetical protein
MCTQKKHGIAWGVIVAVAVSISACSPSPQDELFQANKQLNRLLSTNARFYVTDELTAIRMVLLKASDQLQNEDFNGVKSTIRNAKRLLEKSKKLYHERAEAARNESSNFVMYVSMHLDSVAKIVNKLPRKTYVDQNRLDIARFRMQSMLQQLQTIRQHLSAEDYLYARKESKNIRKSFGELLQFVNIRPMSWEIIQTNIQTKKPKPVSRSHANIAGAR